jgi:hypothetical protein
MKGKFSLRNVVLYVLPSLASAKLIKIRTPKIHRDLAKLDELQLCFQLKIGIVYMRRGQTSDDQVFGNATHSLAFDRFLGIVGDYVTLNGFTGFDGGLDTKCKLTLLLVIIYPDLFALSEF